MRGANHWRRKLTEVKFIESYHHIRDGEGAPLITFAWLATEATAHVGVSIRSWGDTPNKLIAREVAKGRALKASVTGFLEGTVIPLGFSGSLGRAVHLLSELRKRERAGLYEFGLDLKHRESIAKLIRQVYTPILIVSPESVPDSEIVESSPSIASGGLFT